MADIKSPPAPASTAISGEPVFRREEEVRQGIELLFFAYRDFTAEPDAILEQYGFGRAHHRVGHLCGCHPHMTVGDLLSSGRHGTLCLGVTNDLIRRVSA